MKKPILPIALIALMTAGASIGFSSCKDYDDDINNLQQQINENKSLLETLKSKVESGSVITSVTSDGAGIKITLSNGETYTVSNGKDGATGAAGKDAIVWTIGEDGFWYQDGVKTDFPARGPQGDKGETGATGPQGPQGPQGDKGEQGDKLSLIHI